MSEQRDDLERLDGVEGQLDAGPDIVEELLEGDELAANTDDEMLADTIDNEIHELANERDQFKDIAQRLQADFDNYRKRTTMHLAAEIDRAKAKCPDARYVGIADGAKGNWEFLGRHTDVQVTDFWHAAEYLGKAAVALYRGHPRTREAWLDDACHRLKHDPGGAEWVLKQLGRLARERPWAKGHEDVQRAITYFAN